MAPSDSAVITDIFEELIAKWEVFMIKFDLWDDFVDEAMNVVGVSFFAEKEVLKPFAQWDRVREVNVDLGRFLSNSEEQPEYVDQWLKWWIGR